MVVLKMGVTA